VFRGGEYMLVFKAHRLVYHSTLGWRVIKKYMMGGTTKTVRTSPPSSECATYSWAMLLPAPLLLLGDTKVYEP